MEYRKKISITITNEAYGLLKEQSNMSSYINNLILKDYYMKKSDKLHYDGIDNKSKDEYFKVQI